MLLGIPTCEPLCILNINIVDEKSGAIQVDAMEGEDTAKKGDYVDPDRPRINLDIGIDQMLLQMDRFFPCKSGR